MKLSIITPYYNSYEYTKRLAEVLIPQLKDNTEWIIIDDGCDEDRLEKLVMSIPRKEGKIRIWHRMNNSGGASIPRNIGLNFALGEYIAFIDSDDLVTNDYIDTILKNLGADVIYLSWKSICHDIVITKKPPAWNQAVWCRVYKKQLIGNTRFPEDLKIAEDLMFNSKLKPKTYSSIKKQIYWYTIRPDSLSRGDNNGILI